MSVFLYWISHIQEYFVPM
ncbi:hypothetical protein MTR67_031208 [Solanum verrucosum]|uniref:Uncharacterized protein n=1 Tax=Solanum verrucosum TaxID=315347 RepID=A0AAF0U214_SOLVR|nr:hypothetical protein MTR67_031208 [Solanum verrucosum]